MFEHPARNRRAFAPRPGRKRRLQIVDCQATMPAIDRVKQPAQHRARDHHTAHRQQSNDPDNGSNGSVLEAVTEQYGLISQ
jgi:hypothetical protein